MLEIAPPPRHLGELPVSRAMASGETVGLLERRRSTSRLRRLAPGRVDEDVLRCHPKLHLHAPVRFTAGVLGLVSVWMAAAIAHEIRGWKTLLPAILPPEVSIVAFTIIAVPLPEAGAIFKGVLRTLGLMAASWPEEPGSCHRPPHISVTRLS